uniref:G-protein coupled receptors family 1 profile domain-containing protein n=1 Tax=Vombatus ursinus TaxID=29139 RepID=A0A4X2KYP6_VOMUR
MTPAIWTKASPPGELQKLYLGDWMIIFSLLIALVGLVGNSIVLWLLGFRIPRNPCSVYILNLAVADDLFLCCYFLMYINYLFGPFYSWLVSEVQFHLTYMFYTMDLSLLAAISTERCLAVLFPIWYRCHRPKRTSAAVCAVLWFLTGLFGVTVYAFCYPLFIAGFCSPSLFTGVACLFLLAFVLCVSSLTLLLRVQCSSQRPQRPRLYLLVLLTVLMFLLCGLPLGITDVIEFVTNSSFMPHRLPWLLACVNSSANPFIYFFLGSQRHKRREPLRAVLQRALEDEEDPHTTISETRYKLRSS